MEDALIEILETFKYPVIRQGSLAPDAPYPATFFTFWNRTEEEQAAYDNETALVVYNFDVNVYSDDPTTVYSLLAEARDAVKAAGWQTPERGHDIASDVITHTGRGFTCTYLETLREPEPEPTPDPEPEPEPEPDPEPTPDPEPEPTPEPDNTP